MRGSRGGTGGPDPPEIRQRWGLVWRSDGQERGSKGCFYLILTILSYVVYIFEKSE